MKKYLVTIIIATGFLSCLGTSTDYNLQKMGEAVKRHIKAKDVENNTYTQVEFLRAISYEKIPEDKRIQPDDAYLCKVYLKAKWSYLNSSRIYNVDDTLKCYFNEKLSFLRLDQKNE